MSRLVRLYPRTWRDRYEDEFVALLAERPSSTGDVVDSLRGAVDAHLHPQIDVEPQPWTHRLPGLFALGGGLTWAATAALVAAGTADLAWSLYPVAVMLMFASLPGDYLIVHGRRLAVGLGVVAVSALLFNILPWPAGMAAVLVAYVVALGGMLTLVAIRAGIGSRTRWLLLTTTIAIQIVATFPFAIGWLTLGGPWTVVGALAYLGPFGLAWALIGLRLAIAGTPTIVDPPVIANEPEASAA
jgi:hypothetical protein